jgi:RimJ/RimL family protein N-acetyltransferase
MGRPGSVTVALVSVTLRPVLDGDERQLMEWRNERVAVHFSVTGRAVTREEHRKWFLALRNDANTRLWIAEKVGRPVGQLRLDITDDVGVVSIAVEAGHRGQGVGSEMLEATIALVSQEKTVGRLQAVAHAENAASLRAFQRVGFERVESRSNGFTVLEYSLER